MQTFKNEPIDRAEDEREEVERESDSPRRS